jgi:uncharacterized protein (DUF2062 family)
VIVKLEDTRHTWVRRKLVSPVVRVLRHGASPQRLAWSLTVGFIIGINPVLGISTVITIAVTHLFRLNHTGSQIGVHSAYPVQIALFLPFLHAGTVLFGSEPIPLDKTQILALLHEHPMQLVRSLWLWEWHALVVWAGLALVLMPASALLLTHVLRHAMRHPRSKAHPPAEPVSSAT